jgi:tRNA(fMet)-specific endonuclease VapC
VAVVVDTDVVSYVFKEDTRGVLYRPHLADQIAIISFITLAELERWPLIANWGARRQQQLKKHLRRYAVQHSSAKLCRSWAEVMYDARRSGQTISANDAWIAATALQLGVPLVTHNRSDFAGVAGLTIICES